jgi:hypothetical protein
MLPCRKIHGLMRDVVRLFLVEQCRGLEPDGRIPNLGLIARHVDQGELHLKFCSVPQQKCPCTHPTPNFDLAVFDGQIVVRPF